MIVDPMTETVVSPEVQTQDLASLAFVTADDTVLDTVLDRTVQGRLAQIAEATGEDVHELHRVRLDIRRMKELGVLVDVDVHGTSLFTRRANWHELGIPKDDTRRKRLKRGSKDLVPSEYVKKLRSIETRFRQSLKSHSFALEGFKPYRWVPFTAYESWREEWDRLQGELAGLKQEILTNYDGFVDVLAADFAQVACEAWDAIRARRPAGSGEFALVTDDGAFDSQDAFVDHVVARAVAQMPAREQIENDLYVDYKNAYVATGADVEVEHLEMERLRTEREKERAKQSLAWEKARTERDEEWAKQEQLRLEVREAERLSRIRIQEEQAKLAAMREAELGHAREQLEKTVSPWQEVVEQFRAQIFQDVQEIARSIQKNAHVRGRVAQRARGLLDTYRLLGAATGDGELENALVELRSRLDQRPADEAGGKYDTAAVTAALQDVAELTHEAAEEVARRAGAHTRAGALML